MNEPASSAARRTIGRGRLTISPVALGCWPIAGVTTLGTSEAESIATIQRSLELGINHLDTAYVYGPRGESERLIGRAIAGRREEVVLATKCGIHFQDGLMVNDARPDALRRQCDESLLRLAADRVELLYLHAPDKNVPIEDSAGALLELQRAGKTIEVGICNAPLETIRRFHAICPLAAVQLPYNMLQRGIEEQTLPWCRENNIGLIVYWALMKGLLAGRLTREHRFPPEDARLKYPMYQGEEWHKNQDFVDELRAVARRNGRTVAQIVINWTIHQPGISAALCGAKRPWQIEETSGAMGWRLGPDDEQAIASAIGARGNARGNRQFR